MPPDYPILTDDYVAELVANEAEDASLKYSSMGLDAFKSTKRPAHQPKPNTRFLNNIIRDTNTHNKAILARENAESRARLRELDRSDRRHPGSNGSERVDSNSQLQDTRNRILGDISAILGGPAKPRRPRRSEPSDFKSESAGREKSPHRHRHRHKHRSRSPLSDCESGSRRRHRPADDESPESSMSRKERRPAYGESKHESGRVRSSHRHRSHRSPHRDSRNRHDRSISPRDRDTGRRRRHRRDTPDDVPSERRSRPEVRRRATHTKKHPTESINDNDMEESDPLEDLVGPLPAPTVHRRGRGANTATSGIESRFAPDYNPRTDIEPGVSRSAESKSQGDWDDAVEAFRDLQKWKQQGADRLRAAGFSDEYIDKWGKGGQKDESDVQWNQHGGVREWDRGKVMDDDGQVSHKPGWSTSDD